MWGELSKQDKFYKKFKDNQMDYYIIYKDNLPYCDFFVRKKDDELWWIDIKEDVYNYLHDVFKKYSNLHMEVCPGDRTERVKKLLLDNNYQITKIIPPDTKEYVEIYFK